ncbi:hypothetical protein C8Q79DRAFT_930602 [Trametes meyenii]|nr:hypothetical protein C8Q79DRAFT_930602 [Trametes meyenii]
MYAIAIYSPCKPLVPWRHSLRYLTSKLLDSQGPAENNSFGGDASTTWKTQSLRFGRTMGLQPKGLTEGLCAQSFDDTSKSIWRFRTVTFLNTGELYAKVGNVMGNEQEVKSTSAWGVHRGTQTEVELWLCSGYGILGGVKWNSTSRYLT